MKNTIVAIIGVLVLIFLAYMVEASQDKPVNWESSYTKNNIEPFGSFLVYQGLSEIFPNQSIKVNYYNLYSFLKKLNNDTENMIFIDEVFTIDDISWEHLQKRVENGSTVFIAASEFSRNMKDDLGFDTFHHFSSFEKDSIALNFNNPRLKQKRDYLFLKNSVGTAFKNIINDQYKVLVVNSLEKPAMIRIPLQEGAFILSTTPKAFTNISVKMNNEQFIADALSYLPVQKTIWDESFKPTNKKNKHFLKEFLAYENFVWAIYLTIFTLILFVIFQIKRKQRAIPIIEPLKNTSLAFIETIAKLHLKQSNHKDIALKKITYFLAFIRNNFYLQTNVLDKYFIDKLVEKTRSDATEVHQLIHDISNVQEKKHINTRELFSLHNKIQRFKNNINISTKKENT